MRNAILGNDLNRIRKPSMFVLLLLELIMFMYVHQLWSLDKPDLQSRSQIRTVS